MSPGVGVQWCGRLIAQLRSLGSRHSRSVPLLLVTQTNELTQSVGSSTLVMMPCWTSVYSSFVSGSHSTLGTHWGEGGGVNDWWNSGDQGNVELSFETADAFKTVLVLAKKVLLCICTSGGEAAIESNKFRIPAGREAQNRRSICVHNVK